MTKTKRKHENFDLSAVEQVTQRDLVDAEQIRAELLSLLAAGYDVQDDLDTVDEEIAGHERALARFTEARLAASQANTAAAKHARHAQTVGNLERALEEAEQLGVLSTEVLLTVAELEGCLDALEERKAAVHALLGDAILDARHGAPSERAATDIQEAIRRAVQSLTLPYAFAQSIWRAGVGRKGIQVSEGLVQVRPVKGDYSDPAAAVEAAHAKLSRLAEKIAQWSANANIAKEAA